MLSVDQVLPPAFCQFLSSFKHMGSKKTKQRRFEKKRKFVGNQFIKIEENSSSLPAARGGTKRARPTSDKNECDAGKSGPETPRSSKQRRTEKEMNFEENTQSDMSFFMMINFQILKKIMNELGRRLVCS